MMVRFRCPRCGESTYEQLATHSYCVSCNYFPEDASGADRWRHIEFSKSRAALRERIEMERMLLGLPLPDAPYAEPVPRAFL